MITMLSKELITKRKKEIYIHLQLFIIDHEFPDSNGDSVGIDYGTSIMGCPYGFIIWAPRWPHVVSLSGF